MRDQEEARVRDEGIVTATSILLPSPLHHLHPYRLPSPALALEHKLSLPMYVFSSHPCSRVISSTEEDIFKVDPPSLLQAINDNLLRLTLTQDHHDLMSNKESERKCKLESVRSHIKSVAAGYSGGDLSVFFAFLFSAPNPDVVFFRELFFPQSIEESSEDRSDELFLASYSFSYLLFKYAKEIEAVRENFPFSLVPRLIRK